ncbi:hypothetical protein J6590_004499 [Homalodisca vitripennis]|nr:hypothetical protein J6590_004499 [Homalodisca vitripennis]
MSGQWHGTAPSLTSGQSSSHALIFLLTNDVSIVTDKAVSFVLVMAHASAMVQARVLTILAMSFERY